MTSERKMKHLEFIQGVIARLSTHSFRLKTISLIQIGAIVAFAFSYQDTHDSARLALLAGVLAGFGLWLLDAQFIRDEKAYRKLYTHVSEIEDDKDIDFSMDIGSAKGSIPGAMFSRTLFNFYPILIGPMLIGCWLLW